MFYKHDYDKALTRLGIILKRLNDGEELSVTQLAKEFGVSERTVQRDFNERLIGLYPIYQDKKRWRMQEGHKLEKTSTYEDRLVLDILERFADGLGSRFASKAKSLLAKIKNDDFNPFYAKLDIEDIGSKLTLVSKLEQAMHSRFVTHINYAMEGYTIDAKIQPLKIANFEGFWYLLAIDTATQELKKYHLKSINQATISTNTFVHDEALESKLANALNVWFSTNKTPYEVRLYLDAVATKIFKRKPISPTQRFESQSDDGSSEVSLTITNDNEIIFLVKHWIPHIKVLSPKRIEEQIVKDYMEYVKQT